MSDQVKDKKRIQVQIDKDIANKAEEVFAELGMTPTSAINLFYKRVIGNNGIPFEVSLTPREQATKKIQHYSKFVPSNDINTSKELAEWLDDDDWE